MHIRPCIFFSILYVFIRLRNLDAHCQTCSIASAINQKNKKGTQCVPFRTLRASGYRCAIGV
jgi:hypothetical protein